MNDERTRPPRTRSKGILHGIRHRHHADDQHTDRRYDLPRRHHGRGHHLRGGAEKGSRSPTAAALTAVALGVTGIIDWPLLLTAGGTALVVNRLTSRPDIQTRNSTATSPAPSGAKSTMKTKAPRPRGAATNRPRTTPAPAEDT